MEYLFVHFNNGWWLKVNTLEQLKDYHEKTNYRLQRAMDDYENVVNKNYHHSDYLSDVTHSLAKFHGRSFVDELNDLNEIMIENQIKILEEQGHIYINAVGGFCTGQKEYDQFIRRNEFLFPIYTKENIRIKQWQNGTHYYAYIGDLQLKDGDKVKWDIHKEAMEFAEKYITKRR